MAFQLVYTSAAKLLSAGQSGFGTVARSKSITPLLVSAIERVSQFASIRGLDSRRIIHVHRRITAGSNRFHVLTRIVDAGADYSGRTNHIAHHLVISQEEAARTAARGTTPADVLRQFPWLARWEGNARFFEATEDVALESFRPDGLNASRQSWASATGTAAHSRLLSWEGAPRTGVLIVPDAVDRLALLAEALVEFGPQSWSRSFTTSLETTDELSELEWIVTTPAAFAEIEPRCGSRPLLDLTNPASLPTPPAPVIAPPPQAAIVEPQTYRDTIARPPATATPERQPETPSGRRHAEPIPASTQSSTFCTKLIASVAAVLVLSGIIIWRIPSKSSSEKLASDHPKSEIEEVVSAPILDAYQQGAITKMTNLGIPQEQANKIATAAVNGERANAWADFIKTFIDSIKQSKPASDIAIIKTPDGDQLSGVPEWVQILADSKEDISKYAAIKKTENSLNSRIESLNEITNKIKQASNGFTATPPKEKPLTVEECDKFDNDLFKLELENFIKDEKISELGPEIRKYLSKNGNYSNRYDVFSKIVCENFEKFSAPSTFKFLTDGGNAFDDGSDGSNYSKAMTLWNKENLSSADYESAKNIKKSDFVPDNFVGLLKIHRSPKQQEEITSIDEKSPKKAEPPSNHSEIKAPIKEVILVSQAQVEKGVMSKTLKNALATDNALGGITITVDSTRYIASQFTQSSEDPNDVFWSDNWDQKKASIKIHKNGIIQPINKVIEISIEYQGSISYITIDQSNDNPLIKNIILNLEKKDDNTITIKGELASWLSRIQPNSNLNFSALPINDFEIRVNKPNDESNSWCMKIAPNSKKYTTISEEKKIEVKSLWDKFKNSKKDNESLIESMKEATNKDRTKIEPKLTQNKEELKKIISEFKKILATQEIEKNILSEIENEHPNFEKIEITINKITGTQDKSESSINIDQMIEKIKNITVTSQNGRVLIEATK
jgi:hypothetical protein